MSVKNIAMYIVDSRSSRKPHFGTFVSSGLFNHQSMYFIGKYRKISTSSEFQNSMDKNLLTIPKSWLSVQTLNNRNSNSTFVPITFVLVIGRCQLYKPKIFIKLYEMIQTVALLTCMFTRLPKPIRSKPASIFYEGKFST